MNQAAFTFAELWESINRKRAPLKSNPWVWHIQLQKISREEAVEEERAA